MSAIQRIFHDRRDYARMDFSPRELAVYVVMFFGAVAAVLCAAGVI